MGGKALKNTFTRRYSKVEFDMVSQELLKVLRGTFDSANIPLYYKNKETFGDIDIIVNIDDAWGGYLDGDFIRNFIVDNFNPNEIFHNGNCYSFDYKEVQVDFMAVKGEDFNSNFHYLAYNDLGNYIGRIAHRLGLKFGQEGLWYNHYHDGQNYGRVMISKNYLEIFNFLDLDYNVWLKGFDELEDTFKFVTTSKYFDTDMFQFDNLNRINRERNLKRASYLSFIEWINDVYPHKVGAKLDGDLLKIINNTFPKAEFILSIKELEYNIAKSAYIKAKFNGGMLMKIYGLSGVEIGNALTKFKNIIESYGDGDNFDEYILTTDQTTIFYDFERKIINK
jgi:hypothetical protein